MKSFEVQTHRSSQWQTDSTYDDRELAGLRARQIEEKERSDPVRVVEEVFQERTQKYVRRTIYRDDKFQQSAKTKAKAEVGERRQSYAETTVAERPSEKKVPEKAPGQQRSPPMNKRKSLSARALFGILILIVGAGIGAMIALEYYIKLT